MKSGHYRIIDNPAIRLPTIDAGRFHKRNISMVGLLEIDITNARQKIRRIHRKGVEFSFTSYIIKVIGDTVAEHNNVQALLLKDRRLVLFDEVDISISIERKIKDGYLPFPLVLRAVNTKSVLDIDKEIKDAIEEEIDDEYTLFMPRHPRLGETLLRFFYGFPSFMRVLFMERLVKKPMRAKKILGTVGFATVSMTGGLSGWTFPSKNAYSLYIALGSITKKPLVMGEEIKIRDVLNMSVIFDHNIIDGMPARSFMNSLVKRIEKGDIEEYLDT